MFNAANSGETLRRGEAQHPWMFILVTYNSLEAHTDFIDFVPGCKILMWVNNLLMVQWLHSHGKAGSASTTRRVPSTRSARTILTVNQSLTPPPGVKVTLSQLSFAILSNASVLRRATKTAPSLTLSTQEVIFWIRSCLQILESPLVNVLLAFHVQHLPACTNYYRLT